MSDRNEQIECEIHGTSYATCVCHHLLTGQSLGFVCADDSDDPQPDAWCSECEKVRLAEGEWNERSESFTRVSVICADCYEEVRQRNELPEGFLCGTCGEFHPELPMDYGADTPAAFDAIPEAERQARCDFTPEVCRIDRKEFFVRGCLEIPVLDGPRPFIWGVWASISYDSFDRMVTAWESPTRATEPPYFGWLCNSLPLYPDTLLLKTNLHTRPVGLRPLIVLEPTDHPLAIEQRNGITMARVREIAAAMLHSPQK